MGNYLIIGASSGIGYAIAKNLLEKSQQVWGTYNTGQINDSRIHQFHLDVTNETLDFSPVPDQLDGLAYCPGAINLKPFHRFNTNDFIEDYNLQVIGAVKCLQALRDKLKNGSNPSVVLFSTVAVKSGFPFHSLVSSSKGAIEGLSRSLAAEWAPDIRVNTVAPSLTDTPLAQKLLSTESKRDANAERHPLKKIGSPEDIAAMATFLLHDESTWITGQTFHVDGGKSSIISG